MCKAHSAYNGRENGRGMLLFIIFLLPLASRVPTNGFQMKSHSLLLQKSDQGRQDTAAKLSVVKQSIAEDSESSASSPVGKEGRWLSNCTVYIH